MWEGPVPGAQSRRQANPPETVNAPPVPVWPAVTQADEKGSASDRAASAAWELKPQQGPWRGPDGGEVWCEAGSCASLVEGRHRQQGRVDGF